MNRSTGIIRPDVITNNYPGAFRAKGGCNDETGYGQEGDEPENEEDPDIDGPCKDHDGGNGSYSCKEANGWNGVLFSKWGCLLDHCRYL